MVTRIHLIVLAFLFLLLQVSNCMAGGMRIVGYYAGNTVPIDSLDAGKLTHLIYCFGKLDGNRFVLRSYEDTIMIRQIINLKKKFPALKVLLSLGGWGGCETCSNVFSDDTGREEFSSSIRAITSYFGTDGIDLDWEYPVVKGFPGHPYRPVDRTNFTALLKSLRRNNPPPFEISFAAGGFSAYIDSSVDWMEALKYADFINLMSYDLVHGFSTISGHHTPLYSTPQQVESTDHAVNKLLDLGVPPDKIVIGCGFYGRVFEILPEYPVGLYQPCRFLYTFQYKYADRDIPANGGFEYFYDSIAHAPYAIQREKRLLVTFDNQQSVKSKSEYVLDRKLGGMMFWQLCDDKNKYGLLDEMYRRLIR